MIRYYGRNQLDLQFQDRSRKGFCMTRRMLTGLLGALLLFTVACKSKPDDKEAIRAGVLKHLASMQGLNVPNMVVTVTQVSVNGNQATAQVEIRAKSGDNAGGTMNLSYNLEKRGDEWAVVKGAPAGGTLQHPAPGEMPPGAAMPPGHPSGAGSAGPVHPDFNEILKSGQAPAQQPPAQAAPVQQTPPASSKPPEKPY
jgi:hypothetical protein